MDLVRLLPGAPSRNHHAAITITQLSASRHAAVTRAIGFLPRLLLGYVDQRIPAEGDAGGGQAAPRRYSAAQCQPGAGEGCSAGRPDVGATWWALERLAGAVVRVVSWRGGWGSLPGGEVDGEGAGDRAGHAGE